MRRRALVAIAAVGAFGAIALAWPSGTAAPTSSPSTETGGPPPPAGVVAPVHRSEVELPPAPAPAVDTESGKARPARTVHVEAREAVTYRPLEDAQVVLSPRGRSRWEASDRGGQTDGTGRTVFEGISDGTYTVRVTSPSHLRPDPRTFELDAANPHVVLVFDLEPAGSLTVRLLDERGQPVEVSAALRLRVRPLAGGFEPVLSNGNDFRGSGRPTELRYDEVPPGDYEITLHDEFSLRGVVGVCYQPVDAVAPLRVTVRARQRTAADLPVRYRAYLRLRGVDANGAFAGRTSVRVQPADAEPGSPIVLPAPWQRGRVHGGAHFEGYLPPGLYLAEFTAPDGSVYRERVHVARGVLEREVVLPW